MANRYIPDDDIANSTDKSDIPETLYVDLQGDQRTRPIMCATEFSGGGSAHKKKSTSFQITSVTVQGSRLSNDGGDDSADDLDESHTEDISSDILDCSKTTDLENDPLSSADSNANLEDIALPISSKQFIPVKVITSDSDSLGASSVDLHVGFPVANSVIDAGVTFMTSTTSLPVINSQVPIVNSLAEHLQHRFKVVKVVSTEPFKRGRWTCMDFTDPPALHSEQKLEASDGNETLHIAGTFNIVPTENPAVAQFYETPVNQQSISMVQQQQPTQSVYGILLPVTNNTSVTKVQNVGIQATPAPTETSNQQGFNIPTPPVTTQSQATVSTLSTSNTPLMQSQIPQVTTTTSQIQAAGQSSQSQGIYVPPPTQPNLQVSQATQGIPVPQPTQAVPTSSQIAQALPATILQPTQGVALNQPTQVMPVIQKTPGLPIKANQQQGIQFTSQTQPLNVSQQQHVLAGSQPTQDLPTSQQPQGLSAINQSQGVLSTNTNQGIGVPPLHVLSSNQPLVGNPKQGTAIAIPQQSHIIAVTQSNQSVPTSQPNQGIPVPQPCQGTSASQLNQGIPVSQHGISIPQPGQGVPISQTSQGLQIPIPNQGIPISQCQVLPLSQTASVLQGTQTTCNQGVPGNVPLPVQGISNVQQGIPISQNSQVLSVNSAGPGISVPMPNQVLSTHPQELSNIQTTPVLGLPVVQSAQTISRDTQSSQGLAVSQPPANLQSNQGISVTQTPPVISVTQVNPVLPVSTQTISLNQIPKGLPVTQPSSSLTTTCITTHPVVQPVLAIDPMPNLPQNILNLPNPSVGATNESANIDVCVPSQSINAAQQLVSVSETSIVATNASNSSPLSDVIPETVGIKNLQEAEETERLEAEQAQEQSNGSRRTGPEGDRTSGMEEALLEACASSGTNTVAIDNKIEQAMDLVKSHLMFAVREEVDVLKEKITELMERISQLEHENGILKANATPEMLNQLNSDPPQGPPTSGGAVLNTQPFVPDHP